MTQTNILKFANPYISGNDILGITAQIQALNTDEQLAALWYIYNKMGLSIAPVAFEVARFHLVERLLNQVKNASYGEQMEIMRDLINNRDTPTGRTYGALNVNTKLAFWYQLTEWMNQNIVAPMLLNYSMAPETNQTLAALKRLDTNQQIIVLRNIVIKIGIDPFA